MKLVCQEAYSGKVRGWATEELSDCRQGLAFCSGSIGFYCLRHKA